MIAGVAWLIVQLAVGGVFWWLVWRAGPDWWRWVKQVARRIANTNSEKP